MDNNEQSGTSALNITTTDQFATALFGVVERVKGLIEQDTSFRQQLRSLAEAVLAFTEPPAVEQPTSVEHPPSEPVVAEAAPAATQRTAEERLAIPIAIRESAGLGSFIAPTRPAASSDTLAPSTEGVTDADLPIIEQRLRLKAEAARWCATRRRRLSEGADFQTEIDPFDRELIERAKKIGDCFLWTNHLSGPSPSDLMQYEDIAGCFEVTADGIALIRGILNTPDHGSLEQALELLAQAQSALRAAVHGIGYTTDKDQLRAYIWVKQTCWDMQFFINRYMKIEDVADPTSWDDIGERIEELDSKLENVRNKTRNYQSALKRIRFHLKAITDRPSPEHGHDWDVVVQTLDKMVSDGLPPSNTEIRELLLPVVEMVPDIELPQGFRLVLREIDSYLASRPEITEPEPPSGPTAEVKAVADLLRGKTLVLIGGVRRPQSVEALKRAFGLKDVDWIDTKVHESFTSFEPHVARPDVAVVLLAIRWTSHSFGEVKQYCDKHGKPLVRLPAGYNPNQVAAQIMRQCGEQLGGSRDV